MTNNTGKHLTAAYLDQDRKLKELKLEQKNKIDVLTKELRELKQEKKLQKKEQNQKLQETKEALERQIELFKKELHELKKEKETQKEELDQIMKETKEALEKQTELFKTELHEMKKEKEIQKAKQDQKLKETKEALESQKELFETELYEMRKQKEVEKEEQDQKIKVTKETLDGKIELFQKELHERKQEMEMLKQLSLEKQEVDKKIEEQSRCIKQTERNLGCLVYRLASIPLTFMYSANFSTASALLSFVSKNETPKVFDNFLEFLKQELISDYKVTKDAWSYRKGDRINFIWFVDSFKVRQEQQIANKLTDIKSPRFSTGEKGYFLEVWFDPYGYGESRGTHLSCNLKHDVGPYDDLIIFPHQQQFGVTVINLRDRQNDASMKQTVEVTEKGACLGSAQRILPLTKVENVTLNDVLILKISVKHYSA